MRDLPDKNEWKRITEEAFRSSDEHIFSESYRKQRDAMLKDNKVKNGGNAVYDENDIRKRIKVTEGGSRRKWIAPLAGMAAAAVIIPGVLFGTGLLSPSTGVPTTDITETEPATEVSTEAAAVYPVVDGATYVTDWLPEGVHYDAAEDKFFDANGEWYMTAEIVTEKIPEEASLDDHSLITSLVEKRLTSGESDMVGYTARTSGSKGLLYILIIEYRGDISHEESDRVTMNTRIIDAQTGLPIEQEDETADNGEWESIVFVPGTTIYDAAIMLDEYNFCKGEDFIAAFNNCRDLLPDGSVSADAPNLEGFILPTEYQFRYGMTPEEICDIIIKTSTDDLKANNYYEKAQERGMTVGELMTLASIVEKEAPSVETMPVIAAVLKNRLADQENFPYLHADSTRAYAVTALIPDTGDESLCDRYDTYLAEGLPPAPICSPSHDAIEAVLRNDIYGSDIYFYVVDNETGNVLFAKTLEEHEQNLTLICPDRNKESEWPFIDVEGQTFELFWIPEGLTFDPETCFYLDENGDPYMLVCIEEKTDVEGDAIPRCAVKLFKEKMLGGMEFKETREELGNNRIISITHTAKADPADIEMILDHFRYYEDDPVFAVPEEIDEEPVETPEATIHEETND